MVQGGAHGGSVAAPIATRILERSLAMEEGKYDAQLAWLAPAKKQNPFQMLEAVSYSDAGPNVASADEENLSTQTGDAQLAGAGADPDVELDADAQGQVAQQRGRVARAQPVVTPQRKPNFFERLFGARPKPTPTPVPVRRPRTR
jgi:hypothetical protein